MRKTTYLKTFLLTVMLITGLGSNAIAQTWELVKDLNDLSINDEVVLVSSNYSNAMSTTQNTNNRGIEAITKTGETVAINSNVQQFTIVAGTVDNTYAFSTGTGYLNAASSSANYLRTEATLSANSSWLISISNIGVASMTAQGSYTRNVMQYNNGSSIFACYGSASQTGVSIYKKVNQVSSFPAPTITPASGHYRTAQSVTMSSYGNDTTIYYTLNGDDPKAQGTVLTAYTAPFSVSSATTVKAIAVSGTDTSDVATATYTFPIEVSNIAAFLAAGVAENSASATTYNGTTEYKITGPMVVTYQNGSNLYVKDESGALLIFGTQSQTYNSGDVLTGVYGKYTLYRNLPELVDFVMPMEVAGDAVEPTVLNRAITTADASMYVQLEGVEFTTDPAFSSTTIKFANVTYEGAALVIRDNYKLGVAINTAMTYTIVGVVVVYDDAVQLYPISIEEEIPTTPEVYVEGLVNDTCRLGSVVMNQSNQVTLTLTGFNLTENVTLSSSSSLFTFSSASLEVVDNELPETAVVVTYSPTTNSSDTAVLTIASAGLESITIVMVGQGLLPQLEAAVVTDATDVTGTSFTANWNAVTNATSYELSVYAFAALEATVGDGTEANPFTVAEFQAATGLNTTDYYYVKGYIVGQVTSGTAYTTNFTGNTNFALADVDNQGQTFIPVELPSGAVRTAWGLLDNPGNLYRYVVVKAKKDNYFSVQGLKSTNAITAIPSYQLIPVTGSPFTTTATSYSVTGLTYNTDYQYSVVAIGEGYRNSEESEFGYATTWSDIPSLVVTTAQDVEDPTDALISLREAVNFAIADFTEGNLAVNGQYIITFDPTVFTSTSNTITLTAPIAIDEDMFTSTNGQLMVQGLENYPIILDGDQMTNHWGIGANNNVVLKNLTLINGQYFVGGSILNEGSLTVINTTFSGNNCMMNGGAIANAEGSNLVIINSTISGNSARSGGGILGDNANILLLNSLLLGNSGWIGGDLNASFSNVYAVNSLLGSAISDTIYNYNSTENVNVMQVFSDVNYAIDADGTYHILNNGLACGKGIYIWHNADFSALAYSILPTSAKNYLLGTTGADLMIAKDEVGQTITGIASIGSYFTAYTMPIVAEITAPAAICSNSSLTLTAPVVVPNGADITAQGWQIAATEDFANATIYRTAALADSCNGWYLRYYATNATGTSYSNSVQITIRQAVTMSAVANQTVCNNSATTAIAFATSATEGTIRYEWTNSETSIGLAASGQGDIASFTAVNNSTAAVVATITVTAYQTIDGLECSGTNESFTITVNPSATVNSIANQVVCNNTEVAAIAFGTTLTDGAVRYEWTNSDATIGLAATGTGNIAAFTAINSSSAVIIATITVTPYYSYDGVECAGTSESFTISVNPSVSMNDVVNQVVCNGDNSSAVSFTTTMTDGTMRYAWTNDNSTIGLAASGEGDIAAFEAINEGTAQAVATITVTPYMTIEGLECEGEAKSFTIKVNPTVEVSEVNDLEYTHADVVPVIEFTTNVTDGAVRYVWTNDNTAIGLAATGEGNIASFTAANTTNDPILANVIVTPYYTQDELECEGTAHSFVIKVNPEVETGLEFVAQGSLKAYPNPVRNVVTIEMEQYPIGSFAYIYDMNGTVVLSQKIVDSILQIDMTNLPAAIYTIMVEGKAVRVIKVN